MAVVVSLNTLNLRVLRTLELWRYSGSDSPLLHTAQPFNLLASRGCFDVTTGTTTSFTDSKEHFHPGCLLKANVVSGLHQMKVADMSVVSDDVSMVEEAEEYGQRVVGLD